MLRPNFSAKKVNKFNILALLTLMTSSFYLQADELWDMDIEDLQNVRVTSIATGTETPLEKAAAVVSVITDEDIAQMGATDIDQVLETVPGLHVSVSDQAYFPKYIFRGVSSNFNPQALVLINGIPTTGLFSGNRGHIGGGFPVKAVERIEVIRGPGSALYGADAFAGVINIITKDRKDIDQNEVGARAGSFDTYGAWLVHGTDLNGVEIATTIEYQSKQSWNRKTTDVLGNRQAANTEVDAFDARFDFAKDNWRFRAGYQNRNDLGVANGLAQVHDPDGLYDSDRVNVDYTHLFPNIVENLDLESRLSYYYYTQQIDINTTLFPAGFHPDFPDGVIGAPSYREEQARIDISGLFKGLDNHFIRFGFGGYWGDMYETTELKNFDLDLALLPFPFAPRGSLDDVSDTPDVFLPENDRTSYYVFLQDEWQIAEDWALTAGLRYDDYSDFGSTANPRFALVWATSDSITTKLLYSEAFRAPSFNELFVTANPIALGNEDLDPEKIDTYELAFSHHPSEAVSYHLNVYYYEIDDFIELGPTGASNSGSRNGRGGEAEVKYKHSDALTFIANYAYQKSIDESERDRPVGEAPNHQIFARVNWRPSEALNISPQVNWVGKQRRAPDDPRTSQVDEYSTIDIAFKYNESPDNYQLVVTARNIFKADVYEPSPVNGAPSDFAMPGRSINAELSYKF